jgi:hypothetical protein
MATTEHMGLTVGVSELQTEDAVKLRMIIAELDEAVEQRVPGYRTILAQIHSIVKNDPSQVTILEPEAAAVIVRAMSYARGEVFEEKAAKKAAVKKKTPANLGAMM